MVTLNVSIFASMHSSFLRKTFVANELNATLSIPSEWFGDEIEIIAFPVKKQNLTNAEDNKLDALNSLLSFAEGNRVIEKDFHFDREACYDR